MRDPQGVGAVREGVPRGRPRSASEALWVAPGTSVRYTQCSRGRVKMPFIYFQTVWPVTA